MLGRVIISPRQVEGWGQVGCIRPWWPFPGRSLRATWLLRGGETGDEECFEALFEQLESVVSKLEEGCPLVWRGPVNLYEKGMMLASAMPEVLGEAELRISQLQEALPDPDQGDADPNVGQDLASSPSKDEFSSQMMDGPSVRADLHNHTFYSNDSITSPQRFVRECQRRGINRPAVTDHNTIKGALAVKEIAPFQLSLGRRCGLNLVRS